MHYCTTKQEKWIQCIYFQFNALTVRESIEKYIALYKDK